MALKLPKRLSFASESVEFTQLEMVAAITKTKKGKNGEEEKEFKPVKDAKPEIITISLETNEKGRQLIFRYTNAVEFTQDIAYFTLSSDESLPMEKRITWGTTALFTQTKALKYLPLNSNFPGIETISLERVVAEWIISPAFFNHLTVLCEMGHYTPDLVKLLILCISYLEIRDDVRVDRDGKFSTSMMVDLELVTVRYKEQMAGLIEDIPRLSKFLDVSQFTLAPAATPEIGDNKKLESTVQEPLPSTNEPEQPAIEVTSEPEKEETQPKNGKKK